MVKIKVTKKNLKGGKKLGQGSYGCVVNPPLKCLNKQLLRDNSFEMSDEYISKIIKTKYSDVSFAELNMGVKLNKIDMKHNFFVPFINACYFTPQKHNDIIYLSADGKIISSNPDDTNSDSSESYHTDIEFRTDVSTNIMKQNKNKCILKKNNDYINLIGPIAGDNLSNILLNHKNISKINFIKNNYWYIFSYMVKGLSLLHNKNIVHKDIKPSNLVVDFKYFIDNHNHNFNLKTHKTHKTHKIYKKEQSEESKSEITDIEDTESEYTESKEHKSKNKKSNQNTKIKKSKRHYNKNVIDCRIRYIDFGLSLNLNKRKYKTDEIISLLTDGTLYYTPLNILAIKILYKLINRGYDPLKKDFLYQMMLKMGKIYQKNRDYYHYEGIRNNSFNFSDNSESSSSSSSIFSEVKSKNYYLTPAKYESVFKMILDMYKHNTLNSHIIDFLYGWDVYSLGIVFAKIAIRANIKDKDFKNIIFKMIELNPKNRITVNEITKIPQYINNILTSKKTIKINYH